MAVRRLDRPKGLAGQPLRPPAPARQRTRPSAGTRAILTPTLTRTRTHTHTLTLTLNLILTLTLTPSQVLELPANLEQLKPEDQCGWVTRQP